MIAKSCLVLIALIAHCLAQTAELPGTCSTATWPALRSSGAEERIEIATLRCALGCQTVVSSEWVPEKNCGKIVASLHDGPANFIVCSRSDL